MGRPRISVTTLGDLLDDRAETGGDADAVVFPGRRVGYRELRDRARVMARVLIRLGVRPGDRVGILLGASVDLVALLFGSATIGGVAVPVNARFKASELRHVVADSGMAVLVTAAPLAGEPDLPAVLGEALGGPDGLSAQPSEVDLALAAAPELRRVAVLGGAGGGGTTVLGDLEAAAAPVPDEAVEDRRVGPRARHRGAGLHLRDHRRAQGRHAQP